LYASTMTIKESINQSINQSIYKILMSWFSCVWSQLELNFAER